MLKYKKIVEKQTFSVLFTIGYMSEATCSYSSKGVFVMERSIYFKEAANCVSSCSTSYLVDDEAKFHQHLATIVSHFCVH